MVHNSIMSEHRPVLVFADDWGRHPSSAQHLIRRRPAGIRVEWIDTIGTRPPRLDLSTLKRGFGKLRGWFDPKPAETAAPADPTAPMVHAPRMVPSFASGWSRRLNAKLLKNALLPLVESLPMPPIVVTTLPLTADLIGVLPVHRWVYYCVDDFSVWPGYDGASMAAMERDLAPNCAVAIAVGTTLQTHLKQFGHDAHLLTHGVDLEHWTKPTATLPADIAAMPKPLVLFWGVIDRRMDTAWIQALSAKLTTGTLLFVGPQEAPDPTWMKLPRVVVRPPMPFAELPALAQAADVLIMPYIDAPVTQAMQPLKMKEYLATGKPAVVRDLPAVRDWVDALDAAATADEFAALVVERIRTGVPTAQIESRKKLQAEGWPAKAAQFFAWTEGVTTKV